jgi:hypothetical protein
MKSKKNSNTKRAGVAVDAPVRHSVVHVWGGHGEGGLYVDGKKVSDYYTREEAGIVEALGYEPESKRLDEEWYHHQLNLPEKLEDCILSNL